MFSKFRGSLCRYLSDAMHLERTADRVFEVSASVRDRNNNAVLTQLRIFYNVVRNLHQAIGYVGLVEDLAPVRHRFCAKDLVEYCRQLAHISGQLRGFDESRILQKIGAADTFSYCWYLVRRYYEQEPDVIGALVYIHARIYRIFSVMLRR